MSEPGTLTASGIYADHLLAGGAGAKRQLKRSLAVSQAGIVGQRIFASTLAADDLRQKSIHEVCHAIARYVFRHPKKTMALAIWGTGGICGTFADLEEARQQYGAGLSDFEKVADYGNGFCAAGCENPESSISTALYRLFLQRRYRFLVAELSNRLLIERFINADTTFEIIQSYLGAPPEKANCPAGSPKESAGGTGSDRNAFRACA
jgi:hypothetical protein